MGHALNTAKSIARRLAPPPALRAWRWLRRRANGEWVYEPAGWATDDAALKGWDVAAVVRTEVEGWPAFLAEVESARPIGASHEDPDRDPDNALHRRTVECFARGFQRAASGAAPVRFLDWGGGLGYYYKLGRALFPDVSIEYTCKDLPLMVRAARDLQPGLRFVDDERLALDRPYDFVMASSSLQYARDWERVLAALAGATRGVLLIARLPVVERVPSFVVRQRAYSYGYDTEYLGWCFNRERFLDAARSCGLALLDERALDERPPVVDAPEQFDVRGYLFRPA